MHATSHEDSTGTLSVLKRYDAEECKSSETAWLPVTWQPRKSWRVPLHLGVRKTAFCRLPDNELPSDQLSAEAPLVTLAKQCIEDHYPYSLSLEHVADALCTDGFHLGQLFKQTTGMGFSDYVASARVEKAKNLLLNPNYYFTEIASELGFESLSHFSQAFARMVGEPPHAYRARLPGCSASTHLACPCDSLKGGHQT